MHIQDAHTHFFSRPFFETLARLSPKEGDPEALLAEVAGKTGLEIPGEDLAAHRDRWLAEMDDAGVERMVTFASLPTEAEAVSEAARASDGRLLPYTLVNPAEDGAADFVDKALSSMGFRGLLLFPAMHHVHPSDDRCQPLYELAAAKGAPVIVHCGVLQVKLRDLLGLPRPYDLSFANPLGIVPAANRNPGVVFVVPHFGGGFLSDVLMAGMQCENIWVDTSSSNGWMSAHPGLTLSSVFGSALDVFGSGRILFGTDSSTFPRGYRTDILEAQADALADAGASRADAERVLGGNLAALLPA